MVWWKFWKKSPPPNAVDPMIAAAVPIVALLQSKPPFTAWRHPQSQIPAEHEDLIKTVVWGYQLFTYLKLIEAKFGQEVARIIREHGFIALNRLSDDMAKHMSHLLGIIERAVETALKHPITVPNKNPDQPDLEAPPELTMALYILFFEPIEPTLSSP
jgi:hypothetical protein